MRRSNRSCFYCNRPISLGKPWDLKIVYCHCGAKAQFINTPGIGYTWHWSGPKESK